MNTSVSSFLAAVALVIVGMSQAFDPSSDQDYQLFALQIEAEQQAAEYKLNITMETYYNITVSPNVLESREINATLNQCFEKVKAEYPDAPSFCIDSVEQEVEQMVVDSVKELSACTNLTYSWGLLGGLIKNAADAATNLDTLVATMEGEALNCVIRYQKVPSFKRKCIASISGKYSASWNNATYLAQEAYYQISGGGLLVVSDILACQNAENSTLLSKCVSIESEVVDNCLSTTPYPY